MSNETTTTFKGEEEGAGYAAPLADMIAAALLIVLAGWYTVEALGFRAPGGWKTGAGLMPAAAGISLILMAAGLGVAAWRRRGAAPAAAPAAADDESVDDPRRLLLLIAMIFVYLLAMNAITFGFRGYVGDYYLVFGAFEITTILCLCAVMKMYWNGPLWAIAVISVCWTAFLSVVFRNVFLISLPG